MHNYYNYNVDRAFVNKEPHNSVFNFLSTSSHLFSFAKV